MRDRFLDQDTESCLVNGLLWGGGLLFSLCCWLTLLLLWQVK